MVVGSSAYWCDICSYMLMHWSKITPRFVTDLLGVIEDGPICNAGVFRDLTQCGDAKYKIYVLLSFSFRRFWVIHIRISATQCLPHCQDPVIYTAVCHQHTSDPKRTGIHCKNQMTKNWTLCYTITKTQCQIKYHEQTLSGSIVPDRIDVGFVTSWYPTMGSRMCRDM